MKVKHRTLSLHNVVSHSTTVVPGDEFFEIIDPVGDYFKQVLMQNGYYTSGPLVFSYLPGGERFTIMTTLGNRLNVVDDSAESFRFVAHFELDTDFYYRHYDVDEPIPYEEIMAAVAAEGFEVRAIYHVMLKFYGDVILDLYVDAVAA
ncbi:MAG: hypothetical protein ABI067_11270 [Leifsonia sp.]